MQREIVMKNFFLNHRKISLFLISSIFIGWISSCETAHAASIVEMAERLVKLHLPYKYGATNLEQGGFDCSGFVRFLYKQVYGITLPNEAGLQLEYARKHGKVWDATTPWNPSDLKPGDLIFWTGTYQVNRPSPVTHVMIYNGENLMVGAQSAGHCLTAPKPGVGVYPFQPRAPKGSPTLAKEYLQKHVVLYAYARLDP